MANKVQRFGYWVLVGMIVWPLIVTYGPAVEGMLFPVVVGTGITRALPDGENDALVYGSSRKVRDCTYLRMEWYYGTPGERSVLVPLKILERSQVRENGEFSFGPWKVNLPPDLMRNESFAVVYHRCHPFWVTQTPFWP